MNRDFQSLIKRILREYAETLFLALVLALILRFFVISAYRIPNPSMIPTLRVGDFILGYKLSYGFNVPFTSKKVGRPRPQRNEVLIFKCPSDLSQSCIKRVVGLPGDRLQISKKKLIINGKVARYEKISDQVTNEVVKDLIQPPPERVILKESVNGVSRQIFISSEDLDEQYGPLIVPPGHVFMLSDNRDDKEDSRKWGVVPISLIDAKAIGVWFSIDWSPTLSQAGAGPRIRFERLFERVR
jgi:signal peptidase I